MTCRTLDINRRIVELKKLLQMMKDNEKEILAAMKTDLNRNEFEGMVYDVSIVESEIREMIRMLPTWSTPRCYNRKIVTLFSRGYLVPQPYGVASSSTRGTTPSCWASCLSLPHWPQVTWPW